MSCLFGPDYLGRQTRPGFGSSRLADRTLSLSPQFMHAFDRTVRSLWIVRRLVGLLSIGL